MRKLRSEDWFKRKGKDGFIYRAWMKNQGIPADMFEGKPVIGICNTWSELTPCNAHLRDLAESVKKGVLEAGGFPLEFPVMSLGETLMKPTTMLFRNLASMDVEESIRANPLDGVILLCGCDKTTPSLVMGAASVNLPTLVVSGGPMLTGKYKGKNIGTSDLWRLTADVKKGIISEEDLGVAEAGMCRSVGHCAVMGTASTMACMVESLGMSLPGNATILAADSNRKVLSQLSGRRIVKMVEEDLKIGDIITRESIDNAIKVNAAVGGSTNFAIHLLAIAGRLGIDLTLEDFDLLSKDVPLVTNLQPSGEYFMEDFYYSGGLQSVMHSIRNQLNLNVLTVNGKALKDNISDNVSLDENVISTIENPFNKQSGIIVLKGNLCENGAVLKPNAATPKLMKHTGKAVVFENIEDYKARIDDPELDVDENSVLVLKNVGPKGYPGMPEVGNMSIPKKLLDKGINDMVRISDGRMSGTGFGTVVLHVSPEAAVGGNLLLVQEGDIIKLDVSQRSLELLVDQKELDSRRQIISVPNNEFDRGYYKLYVDHVEQAHLGADMDFLKGGSGSVITRDSH